MYYVYHLTQTQAWLGIAWQVLLSLKQELFDTTKTAKEFDFPWASPSFCLWAIPEFWGRLKTLYLILSHLPFSQFLMILQDKKHLASWK